jgi:hypothetical protein
LPRRTPVPFRVFNTRVGVIPVNPTLGANGAIGVTGALAADAGEVTDRLLVADTVNVYAVPLDNPVTVPVVANQETHAVFPPGEEVIVYPVIAEPLLDAGGVQLTTAEAFPAVAIPIAGAPGVSGVLGAVGVTAAERSEKGPVPAALTAATWNLYEVPLLSPVISTDVSLPKACVLASVVPANA